VVRIEVCRSLLVISVLRFLLEVEGLLPVFG
jgi:hypothetical protein